RDELTQRLAGFAGIEIGQRFLDRRDAVRELLATRTPQLQRLLWRKIGPTASNLAVQKGAKRDEFRLCERHSNTLHLRLDPRHPYRPAGSTYSGPTPLWP